MGEPSDSSTMSSPLRTLRTKSGSTRLSVIFRPPYDGFRAEARELRLPSPLLRTWVRAGQAAVPPIPPAHRPAGSLSRYWECWEVDDWDVVTTDPMLLKRINYHTFAVLAVWDLTDVERMVIAGRS